MKCRVQRAERSGSKGRKSSAEETLERIGPRLLRRTEWASVKCCTPAEERFTGKLLEQFSAMAVDQLVEWVN